MVKPQSYPRAGNLHKTFETKPPGETQGARVFGMSSRAACELKY